MLSMLSMIVVLTALMSPAWAGDGSALIQKLSLTLVPTKPAYSSGEDVSFNVVITNHHPSESVFVLPHITAADDERVDAYIHLSIVVRDDAGRRIYDTGAAELMSAGSEVAVKPCNLIDFGPGEHFGRTLSLTNGPLHFPMKSPGRYKVEATARCSTRTWLHRYDATTVKARWSQRVCEGVLKAEEVLLEVR